MNREEFKKIQKPIKDKYREHPDEAIFTLKAEGKLGEGISCSIDTGRIMAEAGLHPAVGGTGLLVCSGDMLLEALIACAGVTLGAVAASMGVEIKSGTIRAEGDLDFRGTLGVSVDAPVGFKAIRLFFMLESSIPDEQLKIIEKLTERYCIVYQTLINSVPVESTFEKFI